MQYYTLGGLKLPYDFETYNVRDDGVFGLVYIHVCLQYNQAQSLTISDSNHRCHLYNNHYIESKIVALI